jgi:hypothetical protein
MNYRGVLTVASGLALAFTACNPAASGSAEKRAINKPWENISPPKQEFTFNAETGDTITLENGTTIRIPAGILVDSKGAHVDGEVMLDFSTMYTPAEIIASGIPMDYDSAGSTYFFQSAGMFEMTAHKGNEQLAIENGKSISLDFPTTRNDQTYSFYRYDTAGGNWGFQDIPEVDSNKARIALEEALAEASVPPAKPEEYKAGTPVIDLEFDLQKHPELSGYNGVIWQYAGSGNDPEDNKWIYQEVWANADLDLADRSQNMYALNLRNGQKTFSTMIRPVLKGADFENALAEFALRMEKFEAEEAARAAEEQRIQQIPPYMSTLSVLVFGVHNLDAIRHNSDFIFADAKFLLPSFTGSRGDVTVYIVSGVMQTTIAYNAAGNKCYYQQGANNKVVAVDHKSGKAYTMTSAEFAAAAKGGSSALTLTMNESSSPVADMTSLEKLIKEL